ncbi:hypothetical protein B0H10DRAFT_1964045 [Mycena sp. CBHHK59/15]|nr:hypothetical protein B0H10DRAFT_1964045 [Mycena sp. CBHHK59/15]
MAPKPPPPPLALSLCTKHDPHPGKITQNRAKQPNGSVQQDKNEKAAQKKSLDAKKTASTQKAAAIELRMEAQAKQNDLNANHPPPSAAKKVLHLQPQPPMEDENSGVFFPLPERLMTDILSAYS